MHTGVIQPQARGCRKQQLLSAWWAPSGRASRRLSTNLGLKGRARDANVNLGAVSIVIDGMSAHVMGRDTGGEQGSWD